MKDKIWKLNDLGSFLKDVRDDMNIVLCHGTFDVLHIGHLKHLEAAKKFGDLLVVTVTVDEFVDKGPGRPAFGADTRAEMLAALDVVDFVAVSPYPSAVEAINLIRPHVYVKGQDYSGEHIDPTGRIYHEQKAVEAFGGKIVFTDEITHSSTNIINEHLPVYGEEIRSFVKSLDVSMSDIKNWFEKASKLKVLVIGETIVDEYKYVSPLGKAPKENIISVRYLNTECFDGGAAATERNISILCPQTSLHTCAIGDIKKIRYVDQTRTRKLFEVYESKEIIPYIPFEIDEYDLVVVNDFGHGFIGNYITEQICKEAKFLALNVQTNSENFGFNLATKYPNADFLCLDSLEARLMTGNREASVEYLAQDICGFATNVLITDGRHGAVSAREDEICRVPAFPSKVVDTMGAGDAVLAITAPLVCVGMPLKVAAFVGNIAGAQKTEIVGHRQSLNKVSLLRALNAVLS